MILLGFNAKKRALSIIESSDKISKGQGKKKKEERNQLIPNNDKLKPKKSLQQL